MFAASNNAGEVSGNDMLNWRTSKIPKEAVCNRYAHADCFNTFHQGRAICISDEMRTRDQIRDGVIKYLNDHPGKYHFSASPTVVIAFLDAFPCALPKQ